MSSAGQLSRRVTFQIQGGDGDSPGGFYDVVTRDARIQPLKGGEAVKADRMAGRQPVVIYVRRDTTTKAIDNSYRAFDARDTEIVWDVQSALVSEDLEWVEVLAVQRLEREA
jgi:hypothetical protein